MCLAALSSIYFYIKSKWLAALLPQNAIEGSEHMADIVTVKNLKVVFNEGNE
ncbi:UNVERIFIED_CONTAM: ABC transporter ATP-binding protein, partial [Lactobacillus paragasseri]|nr:ABC transporter ATP-binding protein [Lactobacillus paragasseri]